MPHDDNRHENLYDLPVPDQRVLSWTVADMLEEYTYLVHLLPQGANELQGAFDTLLGPRVEHRAQDLVTNMANTAWKIDQVLTFMENPMEPHRHSTPNLMAWYLLQVMRNEQMLTDEIAEFRGWLPWKFWRVLNRHNYRLPHRRELQMEVVDMLHFVLDFARLAGMDGPLLAQLMQHKMEINRQRWEGGY